MRDFGLSRDFRRTRAWSEHRGWRGVRSAEWTWPRTLGHIAIGLFAGLVAGMFGVGGGVLVVPALVLVLRYPQRLATGTSLAAIVPTSIVGVVAYALTGHVQWAAGVILAVGAMAGARVGAWALPHVPTKVLQLAFSAFMAAVALSLFYVVPVRSASLEVTWLTGLALLVIGIIAGVLSGLLGVGGGGFVVPILILLMGASDLTARGTSMLMMLPAAAVATPANLTRGNATLAGAALIGVPGCITTVVGAWIAGVIDPHVGNILFAGFLSVVSVQLVVRALRRPRG